MSNDKVADHRISLSARCFQVMELASAASRVLSKQQSHLSHRYHTDLSLSQTRIDETNTLLRKVADQCIHWDESPPGAVVRLHVLLSLISAHSSGVQQLRSDCGPNCKTLWSKLYHKITGSYPDHGPSSSCEKRWLKTCREITEETDLSLDNTFVLYCGFLRAISLEIMK